MRILINYSQLCYSFHVEPKLEMEIAKGLEVDTEIMIKELKHANV